MNLFKKLFRNHEPVEKTELSPYSNQFYEIHIEGNKRTGDQIEDWNAPHISKMVNADGSSVKKGETPNGGKGYIESFYSVLKENNLSGKLPEIGSFTLYKSAKVTDFISGSFLSQYGIILSGKAKRVMEQFNLGDHRFYPLGIEHKDQLYPDYFLLRTISVLDSFIDIESSKFCIREFNPEKKIDALTPIHFNNRLEVDSFVKENYQTEDWMFRNIVAKELNLTPDFPELDLFVLRDYRFHDQSQYVISERLMSNLDEMTGIVVAPIDYTIRITR